MNIIDSAATGFTFGVGAIVGVTAGMWLSLLWNKKDREKNLDHAALTAKLMKERNLTDEMIAESLCEDTLHDKYVRAALTGLCANQALINRDYTNNPGIHIEYSEKIFADIARKIATTCLATKCRENKKVEDDAMQVIRERENQKATAQMNAQQYVPKFNWGDHDDLTNTGEKKK